MSDSTFFEFSDIPASVLMRSNQRCDEFEAAWKGGQCPQIEDFVDEVPISSYPELLWEFIIVDWEYRTRLGEEPDLEEYANRFPQIDRAWFERAAAANPPLTAVYESPKNDGAPATDCKDQNGGDSQTLSQRSGSSVPALRERVGDYEIEEEIARGGQGVVFKARQLRLNRKVALKMILGGHLASETEVQRFRLEAEAAGNLDHPNIVPIYEVGDYRGQPFFSMKLIEGGNLASHQSHLQEQPRRIAETMKKTASAIHHAHQRGILHRDLKPANILLDSLGEPHVTDFGLAKRTEGLSKAERSQFLAGTPSYMPPEQADPQGKPLTTAADVYSLGAVLYHALTGQAPFVGETVAVILQAVLQSEPVPPSRLQPRVPRDLETICLKCLQKDPSKRYASAQDLADDLKRYLTGEPIHARPASFLEKSVKWLKRRPAAAVFMVAAILVGIFATWGGLRYHFDLQDAYREAKEKGEAAELAESKARKAEETAKSQRDAKTKALKEKQRHLYALQLAQIGNTWHQDPHRALELLQDEDRFPIPLREFTWRYYTRLCQRSYSLRRLGNTPQSVALTSDRRYLVVPQFNHHAGIWELQSGKMVHSIEAVDLKTPGHPAVVIPEQVSHACVSPDNRTLVTAGTFTTKIWHVADILPPKKKQESVVKRRSLRHRSTCLTFTPDGKRLVSVGHDGMVKLWDTASGAPRDWIDDEPFDYHTLAYSPKGRYLAAVTRTGKLRLWETKTRNKVFETKVSIETQMAFSGNERILAIGSDEGQLILLDMDTKTSKRITLPIRVKINALVFTQDSKTLICGSAAEDSTSGAIHIIDVVSLGIRESYSWPDGPVVYLAVGNANTLIALSSVGALRLWDLAIQRQSTFARGRYVSAAFTPDGKSLVAVKQGEFQHWDVVTGKPNVSSIPAGKNGMSVITADGKTLVVAYSKKHPALEVANLLLELADHMSGRDSHQIPTTVHRVQVWNMTSEEMIAELSRRYIPISSIALQPNGNLLAVAYTDGRVTLWNLTERREVRAIETGKKSWLTFAPDGNTLGVAASGGEVKLWDVANSSLFAAFRPHDNATPALTFSPDSKMLVSATKTGIRKVKLWRLAPSGSVKLVAELPGHPISGRNQVFFSPDGKTFVWSSGYQVKLFDVENNQVHQSFSTLVGRDWSAAFSPDGRTLAVAAGPTLRLFDTFSGHTTAELKGPRGDIIHSLDFSSDGTTLCILASDEIRFLKAISWK